MGRHDRTTVTVSELRAFDIEPTETGVAVPAISSFLRARRLIGAVLLTKKGK